MKTFQAMYDTCFFQAKCVILFVSDAPAAPAWIWARLFHKQENKQKGHLLHEAALATGSDLAFAMTWSRQWPSWRLRLAHRLSCLGHSKICTAIGHSTTVLCCTSTAASCGIIIVLRGRAQINIR